MFHKWHPLACWLLHQAQVLKHISEAEHHELANAAIDNIRVWVTQLNATQMLDQALDAR